MANMTILYCSSNQEAPAFEQRVRDNILAHCGDMPIVSVTQKPIEFGRNHCVGEDIGVSGFNFFRQCLIGCRLAKTPWMICCEADCFYPPDYFTFNPERLDCCYRNTHLYVMPQHRAFFWRKQEGATHAQIVGRLFYIDILEGLFAGEPTWSIHQRNFPKEKYQGKRDDIFLPEQIEYYASESPVVQVKTSNSMRHYTHSERVDTHELPYWGTGSEFRQKYYEIGYRH